MLEVSIRALHTAYDIKLRQGFEGQVAAMGHIVYTKCKWSILTLNKLGDSCFWTLEYANTICPKAQQGFGQGKPLHFGSTRQGKYDHLD